MFGYQCCCPQDVSHDPDLQMLKFTAFQINKFFRVMHRWKDMLIWQPAWLLKGFCYIGYALNCTCLGN